LSVRINTNIDAIDAQRNLSATAAALSKDIEKLSSGLRINRAADDAAGLFVSEKLRAQTKGLNQAGRNAQDGISMIQTAEGALNETHSILQRMRELTVQAANDTLASSDRTAIKSEVDELQKEITRIADTTEFNGRNLLAGGLAKTTSFTSSAVAGVTGANLGITLGASNAKGAYTVNVTQTADFAKVAKAADVTKLDPIGVVSDLTINGKTFSFDGTESSADVLDAINQFTGTTGVTATWTDAGGGDGAMSLQSTAKGSAATITMSATNNAVFAAIGLTNTASAAGRDAAATISGGETGTLVAAGNVLTSSSGLTIDISGAGVVGPVNQDIKFNVGDGGTAFFQIGANSGQVLDLSINKMDSTSLGVNNLDVSNSAKINDSLGNGGTLALLDRAIASVSSQRSLLGAKQNRLEHTIANLNVASENLTASESRIRDLDIAAEMVSFTKSNILQQAGTSILAQATQSGQGVLSLLR
jgi:flagellin